MAHYLNNRKTLTPAFENQIKLNAYLFVGQGVQKVEDTTQLPLAQDNATVGFQSSVGTSEIRSTPRSEELEQPPLVRKRRRAISDSLSTSCSNDHIDVEAGKQNAQGSETSRSQRLLRNYLKEHISQRGKSVERRRRWLLHVLAASKPLAAISAPLYPLPWPHPFDRHQFSKSK